jgi:soluble cytochrome b562
LRRFSVAKVLGHLPAALKDAIDGMEDMIGYVPEYFQEKWDHQGYIDRAKAALEEVEGES